MKVKSFVIGLVGGIGEAMGKLDRDVARLGTGIIIHSLTDTFCSEQSEFEKASPGLPRVVRVVVYDDPS